MTKPVIPHTRPDIGPGGQAVAGAAPWPEGLIHLTNTRRFHVDCATEGCGRRVSTRFEGSDYCEPCGREAAALTRKAGGMEELISDARLECEALCTRFSAGEASEKEVVDTIRKVARDAERLAALLRETKGKAPYIVTEEWAERMRHLDDGVTPAAGFVIPFGDAASRHIEAALAMARVQDGYARKATCVGEKLIFKANAKAQRQIASYIRRILHARAILTRKEVMPPVPVNDATNAHDIGPGVQAIAGAAQIKTARPEDAKSLLAEADARIAWESLGFGADFAERVEAALESDPPEEIGILQARLEDQDRTIADLTRQLQGQPRRQADVVAGAAQDAILYGTGFMQDRQHVPLEDVCASPSRSPMPRSKETTMSDECHCCTPGAQRDRLCRQCLKVWYDSGITVSAVLAREVRWRKANDMWPWSHHNATVQELEALQNLPLPDLYVERGHE